LVNREVVAWFALCHKILKNAYVDPPFFIHSTYFVFLRSLYLFVSFYLYVLSRRIFDLLSLFWLNRNAIMSWALLDWFFKGAMVW